MSEPVRNQPDHVDPPDRTVRRSWALLSLSFLLLSAVAVARLLDGLHVVDALLLGLLVLVAVAGVRHERAVMGLEAGRRAEAEGFARILQGLSRSVSPDAIVDAIVGDLGVATAADHVVVVRRRGEVGALEATLVSRRPGIPSSTTLLPIADLEDPVDDVVPVPVPVEDGLPVALPVALADTVPVAVAVGAAGAAGTVGGSSTVATVVPVGLRGSIPTRVERIDPPSVPVAPAAALVAERIASRVRDLYGLKHTLVEPLEVEGRLAGAIVLSRRVAEPWSPSVRRILRGAAVEASAALARADSHRRAETRASTDALTGLPNRRYFDEFCGLLARRRRAGDAVGVLMIDIDHFKALNDEHGHAVGDEVLRAVAGAIASAVREDDVPARYGGEEFAVLLRNPGDGVAVEVGERVRRAVSRLRLHRFGVRRVSVSVGVAVARVPDEPIPDLVARADGALYEAKRAGRDRVAAA